jgi:hypothetical protein
MSSKGQKDAGAQSLRLLQPLKIIDFSKTSLV